MIMNLWMRRWGVGLLALLMAGGAMAHGYARHPRSSVQFGFYVGDPWFYPYPRPYYWPRVYSPPVIVSPSPIYIEQSPPTVYIERPAPSVSPPVSNAPPATSTTFERGYWYFCADSQSYYPYAKDCPGGWQKVSPVPEGAR